MPDDERDPIEETPPGPQPDQAAPSDDEDDETGSDTGPGVTEKSADSFPASDPPSW
jgi:hypothetical protein